MGVSWESVLSVKPRNTRNTRKRKKAELSGQEEGRAWEVDRQKDEGKKIFMGQFFGMVGM